MKTLNGNSIDLSAFRNFTVSDTRLLRRSLATNIKSNGFISLNYKLVVTTYYTGSDIATLLTNKVADGTFTTYLQSSTSTELPFLQSVFSNKTDLSIIVSSRSPSTSPTKMGGSGDSSDGNVLGGGAIAGITIACVFVVAAIVATWYYFHVVKHAEPKTARFGDSRNERTTEMHEFISPVPVTNQDGQQGRSSACHSDELINPDDFNIKRETGLINRQKIYFACINFHIYKIMYLLIIT